VTGHTPRRVALWAGLLLMASPLLAGDIHVDFDKDFDFSSIHSYAWQDDPKTSLSENNPPLHARIVEVVGARFYRAGIQKNESTPDIYVGYRVSTSTDLSLDSGYYGYGYPLGWYWDPYWNNVWATPNMPSGGRTYTKGTLLIEAWTAGTKKLIWRGSATAAVTENYDKMYNKIFKLVGQIADRWHAMRADQEKEKAKASATR
jgi:hypothetical protein